MTAGAVNLGVAFTADVNGYITGVRFYKAAANTGTHVGACGAPAGTLLAQATFTNETASGWQQVSFSTPVAVTAGTTYVGLVPRAEGALRGHGATASPTVNGAPIHALATANAERTGSTPTRDVDVPRQRLPGHQLLGRPGLQPHLRIASRGANERHRDRRQRQRDRLVDRACGNGDVLHRHAVRGYDGGHAGDGQRLPAGHIDHAERADQRHRTPSRCRPPTRSGPDPFGGLQHGDAECRSVPGAPTKVTAATAGPGSVTVTWSAGLSSTITSNTVTRSWARRRARR